MGIGTFLIIAFGLIAANVGLRRNRRGAVSRSLRSVDQEQYASKAMKAMNEPHDPLHETFTGTTGTGHRQGD